MVGCSPKNISLKVDENGLMIFQGFHYFSPKSFLGNYEQKYLLALKDKKIIGVLKLSSINSFFPENQYISFIDIHEDFRENGVAKSLLIKLDKILTNKTLYLTKFSQKAKSISLDKKIYNYCKTINIIENFFYFSLYKSFIINIIEYKIIRM